MHFVSVVPKNKSNPKEVSYIACNDVWQVQNRSYNEFVFPQESSLLARYVVTLQPDSVSSINMNSDGYYQQGRNALEKGDEAAARDAFQLAAKDGHAIACFMEGLYHFRDQNYEEAVKSSLQSVNGNFPYAHFILATYFEFFANPQDLERATAHYATAAQANHHSSKMRLEEKILYRHGKSNPKLFEIAQNPSGFFANKKSAPTQHAVQPALSYGYKKS